MQVKVAILGEENSDIVILERYLYEYSIDKDILIKIEFINESFLNLKNIYYDIVFMNIQRETTNKLECAKFIHSIFSHTKIIVISKLEVFYHEAFKAHIFDYILPPFTQKYIFQLMDDILKHNICIIMKSYDHKLLKIKLNEIIYFESHGRICKLITIQKNFMIRNKIRDLAISMKNCDFCIPHQSFIINYNFIESYSKTDVILIDGTKIPISQTKRKSFEEKFKIISTSKLNIINI